jgi:hypothetical protein
MGKLTIAGHSLGGCTAIDAAIFLKNDIKCVISLDPFIEKLDTIDLQSMKIPVPFAIINTFDVLLP